MIEQDLAHHGILGMKWGVRRTDAQLGKVEQLSRKKEAIRKQSGVGSTKYMFVGRKHNVENKKLELMRARQSGNTTDIASAKSSLDWAKRLGKKGSLAGYLPSMYKDVFGKNLSKKEVEALTYMEMKAYRGQERTKQILQRVGPLVTSLVTAAAIAKGKSVIDSGAFDYLRYRH